jgi:hypothetical protein
MGGRHVEGRCAAKECFQLIRIREGRFRAGRSPWTFSASQAAVVDDVAPDEAGLASGLLTSSLQIGGALGLAVFVTLAGEVATINSAAQVAGTRTVLLAPAGCCRRSASSR